MSEMELEYHKQFARRIVQATDSLFGDQAISDRVRSLCADYEKQCENIILTRGISLLTIAIVGAKGQGKSWVARQLIKDPDQRHRLPSGILGREATTKLYWIGPLPPESLVPENEVYIHCDRSQLVDLGQPFMLLDTPGVTDADRNAVQAAKKVLSLAPIKFLVVRRDQIRASINTELASSIEGAVCLPIITCIPPRELPPSSAEGEGNANSQPSDSLSDDLRQLNDWLRACAPQTQLLSPILIEDFEASGQEALAGEQLVRRIAQRLHSQSLDELARTRANRLSANKQKLRRNISRLVDLEAPYLATAVRRLHDEANALPKQAVEAVLGSPIVLHTAIRGRLRAQLITDTSPLWFPYRTLLSLLSLTQGAWDRLILALTGSVPSLFGTLASWAKNVQTSNKVSQEMQDGIRERLTRQVTDRLEPIHRQFHSALHQLNQVEDREGLHPAPRVRMGGIEELQSQSRQIFESRTDALAVPSFQLQLAGFVGTAMFWGMMSGPVVWVYRKYLSASWIALGSTSQELVEFPHPSSAMIFSSLFLSVVPVFLFAMIIMTFLLRRGKVVTIANSVQEAHHALIEKLRNDGVLRLAYEDRSLEHAEFLIQIDRTSGND